MHIHTHAHTSTHVHEYLNIHVVVVRLDCSDGYTHMYMQVHTIHPEQATKILLSTLLQVHTPSMCVFTCFMIVS